MDYKVIKVTLKEATSIIETRLPSGLFYCIENGVYVGIDNSYGDAWVEEFKSKSSCVRWLKHGRQR